MQVACGRRFLDLPNCVLEVGVRGVEGLAGAAPDGELVFIVIDEEGKAVVARGA